MNKLKVIIWVAFCASGQKIMAQGPPPEAAPAMAVLNDSNKILVDEIIQITRHEEYFKSYCEKRVMDFAKKNKWKKEHINEIIGSIQFEYYNSTIYNSYAFYNTEQLNQLIGVLTFLNSGSDYYSRMVLTNMMMQSNLDGFVESVIAGKYVLPRKGK
jgi:hypothetical protein